MATGAPSMQLPATVRSLRLRLGLSQRQLGRRMSVPRSYVSKIENDKATPMLSSLERLARALEVTVPELLSAGEGSRKVGIRELARDAFVAELLPFVSKLSELQRRAILVEMNSLALRSRSRAAAAAA